MIDTVVQGLLLGGLYCLFALGQSLMFGVMRLTNTAQGDFIVLAAYLALTAVVLPLDGPTPERITALVVHLGAAAALLALIGGRREATSALQVLADWLPLLLVPVLYAELPLLMEGLPGPVRYHDPLIARLEAGKHTPDLETLVRLARLLGLDLTVRVTPRGATLDVRAATAGR